MMKSNTEPVLLDRAIRFAPLIFLVLAIVSGGICLGFRSFHWIIRGPDPRLGSRRSHARVI